MQTRRYSMGQLVPVAIPKIPMPSKQEILRNFDFPQLHFDYNRFLFFVERHDARYGMPLGLDVLIYQFCRQLTAFLNSYPLAAPNIDAQMKHLVEQLRTDVAMSETEYGNFLVSQNIPWRLDRIIQYSYAGVKHFIHQFDILMNSYSPGQRVPCNPTDWERKQFFIDEVIAHQAAHGVARFPRHKIIQSVMESHGFNLPERTYGDWRRQWKAGTILNVVQQRKIGNK